MPIILTTAILVVPSYVSNLGLLPKVNLPYLESFLLLDWLFCINSTIQFVLFDNCFKSKIFLINYRKWHDTWSSGIQTTFYKTSNETNNTSRTTMLATLATVPIL
jgi:hypothetical protein